MLNIIHYQLNDTRTYFPSTSRIRYYDSLNPPTLFDPKISLYKEWHHFNLFDAKNKIFGLFNFAIDGNPYDKNKRILTKNIIIRDGKGKYYTNIEAIQSDSFNISHLYPDLGYDDVSITYHDGLYNVDFVMNTMPISGKLKFQVACDPISTITKPFGSGYLGWTAIPRVRINGNLTINEINYKIKNALGYHDHDWGRFKWGERVGWIWALFLENKYNGITFLIDVRTNGIGGKQFEKFFYIYKNGKIDKMFSGADINIKLHGNFNGKKITIPGIERLLHPEISSEIPAKIIFEAQIKSNKEKISIEYTPNNQ